MILFISDLHLQASHPETTRAFLNFLTGPARHAEALWILGDLFDFWIGDDDLADPFHAQIADALASLSASGVKLRIMAGNRDFLLGETFARRCGAQLVSEPALIQIGKQRVALLHGDAECTDDLAYQRFRRKIRAPLTLAVLRKLPRTWRRALAKRIRQNSESSRQSTDTRYMDVNPDAIQNTFRQTDADWMIHGHTHRPAQHILTVDGRERQRWVLSDWHDTATWLEATPQGLKAHN